MVLNRRNWRLWKYAYGQEKKVKSWEKKAWKWYKVPCSFKQEWKEIRKKLIFDRWRNKKKMTWEKLSLIKKDYLLCFWHPLVWGVFPNQIHQLDLGSCSRHSYNFQKPESNLKFPLHLSCSAKPGKWILVCNFHWHKNSNR